jgi:hypothetical protein
MNFLKMTSLILLMTTSAFAFPPDGATKSAKELAIQRLSLIKLRSFFREGSVRIYFYSKETLAAEEAALKQIDQDVVDHKIDISDWIKKEILEERNSGTVISFLSERLPRAYQQVLVQMMPMGRADGITLYRSVGEMVRSLGQDLGSPSTVTSEIYTDQALRNLEVNLIRFPHLSTNLYLILENASILYGNSSYSADVTPEARNLFLKKLSETFSKIAGLTPMTIAGLNHIFLVPQNEYGFGSSYRYRSSETLAHASEVSLARVSLRRNFILNIYNQNAPGSYEVIKSAARRFVAEKYGCNQRLSVH